MENEVRHRLAMAQMVQPTTQEPPMVFPELALPYADQESYFDDFKILENKILQDMAAN